MNPGFLAALVTVAAAASVLLVLGQIKANFDSDTDLQGEYGMVTAQIIAFGKAIAQAEGFGIVGAIPTLAHNPGDLKIPGWTGPTLGTEGISVFANDAEGWDRLYRQLMLIRDGKSHVYTPFDSIAMMATHWTDTAPSAWAANVAAYLEVPVGTQLRDLLGPGAQ